MILNEEMQGSCVYSTLYGMRGSLLKVFGENPYNLRRIPIIMSDDLKQPLREKLSMPQALKDSIKGGNTYPYPYAYAKLQSITIVKDQNNIKNIARSGYIGNLSTDNKISRGFLFPAALNCEFHYIDSDVLRAIYFAEKFLIIGNTGGLDFDITYDDSYKWTGVFNVDDTLSVNSVTLEDSSSPAETDVVCSIKINTKIGFIKSVTKTNERMPFIDIKNSPSIIFSE